MATPVREWPNTYGNLRDDMAELFRGEIKKLELITKNTVNSEEEMEAIAADVISDLNLGLRALERAGASTDPLAELEKRARSIQKDPCFMTV